MLLLSHLASLNRIIVHDFKSPFLDLEITKTVILKLRKENLFSICKISKNSHFWPSTSTEMLDDRGQIGDLKLLISFGSIPDDF